MKKTRGSYAADVFRGLKASDFTDIVNEIMISQLLEKSYKIQHTSETYRTINHWSEIGLIDDDRSSKSRDWRVFSCADLIWIRIIQELREFGLSLEKIAVVKKCICPKANSYEFCSYLVNALKGKCMLIVEKDGKSSLINAKTLEAKGNFICIDIAELEKKVMADAPGNLVETFDGFSHLDNDEQELLAALRSKKYQSINVVTQNGEIQRLEMEEDVAGTLFEAMQAHDFQDITVKMKYGKIMSFKRVIKHIPISKAVESIQAPYFKSSGLSEAPKPRKKNSHAIN